MKRSSEAPADLLRAHGLQVTAQRLAVLRAVDGRPHCTAAAVEEDVRESIGAISRQAVYDALAALTGAGLVRRVQPAGLPALFDPRTGDDHHHVVCRTCDRVEDVDCTVEPAAWTRASDDTGYALDEAELVFWGTCPDCRDVASHDAN